MFEFKNTAIDKKIQEYINFKKENLELIKQLDSLRDEIRFMLKYGDKKEAVSNLSNMGCNIEDIMEILKISESDVWYLLYQLQEEVLENE